MVQDPWVDIGTEVVILKISTLLQSTLYGAYIVLFGICISILLKKRQKPHRCYLLAAVLLFLLSSANIALFTADDIWRWSHRDGLQTEHSWSSLSAAYSIALASSVIANGVLLWRCYVIWGKQRKIVVLPTLIFFAAHIGGIVFWCSGSKLSGLILILFVTGIGLNALLLSALVALRAFKIGREVAQHLGPQAWNIYNIVLAATLECGLVYSLFVIVLFSLGIESTQRGQFIIINDPNPRTQVIFICIRAWATIAGLDSTVIIVRVALGISLHDVESTIMSNHTAEAVDEPPVLDNSRQSSLSP
ncbi:hypothetical protein Moror_2456 [Moniliophthora roreri MCA 2997]|uniref:Integral membrane protein n=1 Tax=Moniliophthora roreri (strain MCA 2997) TaxID=1381753 RepID=V2WVZ6_MONRO|nr:hypothetical protein Moror_2456 [Moniliophthora roreri MCA 2997]